MITKSIIVDPENIQNAENIVESWNFMKNFPPERYRTTDRNDFDASFELWVLLRSNNQERNQPGYSHLKVGETRLSVFVHKLRHKSSKIFERAHS